MHLLTGEDASEYLLNLSPYEMKILLHYILSGKEIGVPDDEDAEEDAQLKITPTLVSKVRRSGIERLRKSMKVSMVRLSFWYVLLCTVFDHAFLVFLQKSANLMLMFSGQDGKVLGSEDSLPPTANGTADAVQVSPVEFPEKTGRWLRRRRMTER